MIYITGDTHGDFTRIERFCERFSPARDDTMIILGDAGFNYYGGQRDQQVKQQMAAMPITIFSIHGNHEIRPGKIPTYHLDRWRGGSVFVEDAYPNLIFAVDGEVYDMEGLRTIAIGGAYSIDKYYRLAHGWNWWEDEQPTPIMKKGIEKVLDYEGWKVDIVISHTVPLKYEPVEVFLPQVDQSMVDKSTETWLDQIEDRLQYRHWYAGHYHTEKEIDKLTLLFESIREFKAKGNFPLPLIPEQFQDEPLLRTFINEYRQDYKLMIYVLSDIHGDMDAFDSILSQIQLGEDDHLYIIGDVVDRGLHSIELIQRIREMRNTTMMLGNHEYMMLGWLRHPKDWELKRLWYHNGGSETEAAFEKLTKDEQEDMLQYLEGLPLQVEVTVNGELYLLVHARPKEHYKELHDWYKNEVEMAVWSRIEPWTELPEEKTIVFGHTPTIRFQPVKGKMRIYHGDRRIGIDCGCAYPEDGGQLGCLRLEDMKEFYSSGECGEIIDLNEWEEKN